MSTAQAFIDFAVKRMGYVKSLGDGVLSQKPDLFKRADDVDNSIAIIIQHLEGNMRSRWTHFLTSDGEKPDRQRDREFEPVANDEAELLVLWQRGWELTLATIQALQPGDLGRDVLIRGESLNVMDAILRQISHYSYHVGQMVTLARLQLGPAWQTLSIARGKSADYKP
jgi:hypothetical protein